MKGHIELLVFATGKVTKPYYIFLVIFLLIIPVNISAVEPENRLIPYALIDSDEIVESSGIIRSKKYPGVFWTHNDSGDSARIFAISEDGKIIKPKWFKGEYKGIEVVNATHIDWEDIATDRAGNLIMHQLSHLVCLFPFPRPLRHLTHNMTLFE